MHRTQQFVSVAGSLCIDEKKKKVQSLRQSAPTSSQLSGDRRKNSGRHRAKLGKNQIPFIPHTLIFKNKQFQKR